MDSFEDLIREKLCGIVRSKILNRLRFENLGSILGSADYWLCDLDTFLSLWHSLLLRKRDCWTKWLLNYIPAQYIKHLQIFSHFLQRTWSDNILEFSVPLVNRITEDTGEEKYPVLPSFTHYDMLDDYQKIEISRSMLISPFSSPFLSQFLSCRYSWTFENEQDLPVGEL